MPTDMPPFGGYDHPHLNQTLDWIMSYAKAADWHDRLSPIDQDRFDSTRRASNFRQVGYDHQYWPNDDPMAWYVYLGLAAAKRPFRYEPREGCRIIPIFKRCGMHLSELKSIGGVDERVQRLVARNTKQPDSILFELLVALLWRINGFDTVQFLGETTNNKTPDFRATKGLGTTTHARRSSFATPPLLHSSKTNHSTLPMHAEQPKSNRVRYPLAAGNRVALAHVLRSVSMRASAFRESSIALTMNALLPASFIEHPMCQHAVSSITMKRS